MIDRETTDFFQAGGTLLPDAPSYVKRSADDDLLQFAQKGTFCYVLTPRQMGKSSLMSRTADQLKKQKISPAIIDLTKIGTVTVDQWYLGLLTELEWRLRLSTEPIAWWQARASLSPAQRFTNFLRHVVLKERTEQIVIFIDEIDTTLNLEFRDDFFAAIRAMYNARAHEPEFKRLTFVLLGVASPTELIKDNARTPFNIGEGIALSEFALADAVVLQKGLDTLFPAQGEAILAHIYYWTSGHPYLTQRLCLSIASSKETDWSHQQIDALVQKLFLSEAVSGKESNLQFVQKRILSSRQKPQLLRLYQKIHKGTQILDDVQSIIQNELKLAGLVKVENGYLQVRNQIYRHVFDLAWVRKNTKIDWTRILAGVTTIVAILAISLLVYNAWIEQRVEKYTLEFYQAKNDPQEQARSLADILRTEGLFWGSQDYDHQARALFYNSQMSAQQQLAYFDEYHDIAPPDLIEIVPGLYVALADVEGTDNNRPLLEAMAEALNRPPQSNKKDLLKYEIHVWLDARQKVEQGQLTQALDQYNEAIKLNGQNPATRYERAIVHAKLERYEDALSDLDLVLAIVQSIPVPTSESTPTPTIINTPTQIQTRGTTDEPAIANVGSSAQSETEPSVGTASDAAPMPTITPTLAPFTSELDPSSKMIRRIQDFIQENSGLERAAANADASQYPNLALLGALPSEISTATTIAIVVAAQPRTLTPVPPTVTRLPTSTPISTLTPFVPIATNTPFVPMATNTPFVATNTPILQANATLLATNTPIPTNTPFVATNTPIPSNTPFVPTNTPIPSNTPFVATNTPIPSNTPFVPTNTAIPTNTPSTYPAPVLLAPNNGASISRNTLLQWSWNGTLGEDEHFDVRVWRDGEPSFGIAWTKERSYLFDPDTKGNGSYLWSVTVIRGQNGQWQADLSDPARPRSFVISGAVAPTSTPPP